MEFLRTIYVKNRLFANLGTVFLAFSLLLIVYIPFNSQEVLGINSMIKPLKFALSTWVYAWSMAYLLSFVENQKKVRSYTYLAMVVMLYENAVISVQAFRGKLSHFNQTELVGGILYSIMGIMIVWLTTATLVLAVRFIAQKKYDISSSFALSIQLGLVFFVIFSFLGGYMSVINSHQVGGQIGEKGLPVVNWSVLYGDIRVAHFFGIHSLQIIPLFGYLISKKGISSAKLWVWLFAIAYFGFICFTLLQALSGTPFFA
jgi:hypothetical protein